VKRDLEVGWWLKAPWPCCCCSMMCQVVWENTELFGPKSDYYQF
jgi:succinate dehydrogenase/fumarate reductase-like Fe-S protein